MAFATAARPSPAAGTSTSTSEAPSRARVRGDLCADPAGRAGDQGHLARERARRRPAGAPPPVPVTVSSWPSTNADLAERKNSTAPSVDGASIPTPAPSTTPLPVAPPRSSLASERRKPSTAWRAAATSGISPAVRAGGTP